MATGGIGRRRLLGTGIAGAVSLAAWPAVTASKQRESAVYFVPGYHPGEVFYRGRPLIEWRQYRAALPVGYEGPVTMLTRVDEASGQVDRALFPLRGHSIARNGGTTHGFFSSMEGRSMLSFDPVTLTLDVLGTAHREDYVGGGHAVYSTDDAYLYVTERRRRARYGGSPSDHFGVVTVRDSTDLKVLAVYDCAGVAPHEINLLADGRHVAIANYGSVPVRRGANENALPHIVEPSVTVLELGSGRLVHKAVGPDRNNEIRHLAAYRLDRLFLVQARHGTLAAQSMALAGRERMYERDRSLNTEPPYLPAPVLRAYFGDNAGVRLAVAQGMPAALTLQAQSIVYDPDFDEAICVFTSSHCLAVFDGTDGAVKRIIRTDERGLRYPRGIDFHPDGQLYVVTGSWAGLLLLQRGRHEIVDRRHELFFGHSHMTAGI